MKNYNISLNINELQFIMDILTNTPLKYVMVAPIITNLVKQLEQQDKQDETLIK